MDMQSLRVCIILFLFDVGVQSLNDVLFKSSYKKIHNNFA